MLRPPHAPARSVPPRHPPTALVGGFHTESLFRSSGIIVGPAGLGIAKRRPGYVGSFLFFSFSWAQLEFLSECVLCLARQAPAPLRSTSDSRSTSTLRKSWYNFRPHPTTYKCSSFCLTKSPDKSMSGALRLRQKIPKM